MDDNRYPGSVTIGEFHIEQIVREVVRRLSAAGAAGQPARPVNDEVDPATTTLSGRVISLEQIKRVNPKSNRLRVLSDAVVTPAARDELKQRGIRLERGQPQQAVSESNLLVAAVRTTWDLHRWLKQTHLDVTETLENDCPDLTAEKLAAALAKKVSRAIVFTGEPALVLCRLNRHQGVRAACGQSVKTVQDANDCLSPNAIVLNPMGMGDYGLNGIVRAFVEASC